MPIRTDADWNYDGTAISQEKRVYRDALLIGRIRRWREEEPSELTGEWFTAERWRGQNFEPSEGTHSDFDDALQRLVFDDGSRSGTATGLPG